MRCSAHATPATIQLGTPLADDYLKAMEVAGEYAYAGRDWVVDRVLRILGARDELRVHNHHSFAWWEKHDGQQWLVVRKGAMPGFPGRALREAGQSELAAVAGRAENAGR